jgi:uncharacterized phage protein gp47/JayE|nr:MAG TPA: Baseplate J like protein [Caudoviricetes sp.]
MTISSPVFQITADGFKAPGYSEIFDYFKSKAQEIFGTDINLDSDTQDGQLLAIFALAISDVNSAAQSLYWAYNPNTATGIALDSAVKTNGISRRVATHSQVDLKIVGQAGTVITNGTAIDTAGNKWVLPTTVTIPLSGEVTATAAAEKIGPVPAAAGSITQIGTPTLGWQTVTNDDPATAGMAVESDAELRARQALSTMQPNTGLWDGIISSVRQINGVTSVAGRHNDTGATSDDGIPAHTIALVVDGGDATEIAEVIYAKKSQGVSTYGSTKTQYIDTLGNVAEVDFSRPTPVSIAVVITLRATETWLSTNEDDVKTRVSEYVNGLEVGAKVDIMKVVAAIVRETTTTYDGDFYLESVTLNGNQASVSIAWNEKATVSAGTITVNVE